MGVPSEMTTKSKLQKLQIKKKEEKEEETANQLPEPKGYEFNCFT